MTKEERALELHSAGYNCAQAVALAFAEEIGVDEGTLARVSSTFGGGMGKLGEVCGAASGMLMAVGAKIGVAEPQSKEEKEVYYARVRALLERFRAERGALTCRDLVGGLDAAQKKPICQKCIACAARIADEA